MGQYVGRAGIEDVKVIGPCISQPSSVILQCIKGKDTVTYQYLPSHGILKTWTVRYFTEIAFTES